MKEYYGNIIDLIGKVDAVCITTNLFVKKNGRAVMGRGIAKAICDVIPDIDLLLGAMITKGIDVGVIVKHEGTDIIAFPVKPESIEYRDECTNDLIVSHMRNKFVRRDIVPGWACKADIVQIGTSATLLAALAGHKGYKEVYLPRPGCGAGELKYEDVKSLLDHTLDSRFLVSTFKR